MSHLYKTKPPPAPTFTSLNPINQTLTMKNSIIAILMMASCISFAQKKDNGKVYINHPAIKVVEDFTQAFVTGDSTKMANLLTEDFKAYNGLSTKPDEKGRGKAVFLKNSMRWSRELDYFSITDFPGAYPDAIEYKQDNDKEMVWVQTWEMLKGIHKTTGVKFTSPVHRLYQLTKDNKINVIIDYFNEGIFDEQGSSYGNRTNGTIYNHHENINTVRKMLYAFENSDVEKSMSYYRPDARIYDINQKGDEPGTLAGEKSGRQNMLKNFEIKSIEMVGYPDYLEYEMGNGRSVLSWWKFHLVRKSDKKEISLYVHLNDDFDADGKIVSETQYYNGASLEK